MSNSQAEAQHSSLPMHENGTHKSTQSRGLRERQFKHANGVMNMIIRNGIFNALCEDGSLLLGIHNDIAKLPSVANRNV